MVAEATINKHASGLMNQFLGLYVEKYGKGPTDFNRFRDKWIFRNMYEDLGEKQASKVIGYYFETGRIGHPIKALGSNYDRLSKTVDELEKDKVDRLRLRKETEKRVREWEEVHGDK